MIGIEPPQSGADHCTQHHCVPGDLSYLATPNTPRVYLGLHTTSVPGPVPRQEGYLPTTAGMGRPRGHRVSLSLTLAHRPPEVSRPLTPRRIRHMCDLALYHPTLSSQPCPPLMLCGDVAALPGRGRGDWAVLSGNLPSPASTPSAQTTGRLPKATPRRFATRPTV
jgi:hypothetical protein